MFRPEFRSGRREPPAFFPRHSDIGGRPKQASSNGSSMSHYYPAVRLSELDDGQLRDIEIAGRPVLLVRIGAEVYAASNVCPHAGSRLSNGVLKNMLVQCPMHGIRFRLTDGSIAGKAMCDRLPIYSARVRDGLVEVAFTD